MIPSDDVRALEAALRTTDLAVGVTRVGSYEMHGEDPEALWLLVIRRTARMPFDGPVIVEAGTVVLRLGYGNVLCELRPPDLTGCGWNARVDSRIWFGAEPASRLDARRLHEELLSPALRRAGLCCEDEDEDEDEEGISGLWSAQRLTEQQVAEMAVRLVEIETEAYLE